jgi:hypothetical protein
MPQEQKKHRRQKNFCSWLIITLFYKQLQGTNEKEFLRITKDSHAEMRTKVIRYQNCFLKNTEEYKLMFEITAKSLLANFD